MDGDMDVVSFGSGGADAYLTKGHRKGISWAQGGGNALTLFDHHGRPCQQPGGTASGLSAGAGSGGGHAFVQQSFNVMSPAIRRLMNVSHGIFTKLQTLPSGGGGGAGQSAGPGGGGRAGVGFGQLAVASSSSSAQEQATGDRMRRAQALDASRSYREALKECLEAMYLQEKAGAVGDDGVCVQADLPHGVSEEDYERTREFVERAQETLHICELFLLGDTDVISPQLLHFVHS